MSSTEKTALIMEGGAMRGMFTAGVTDVMMENDITFDGAAGTSAGAAYGCNFKSHQIGRVIRYHKKYCRDRRFASLWSLFKTGDLFGADFCYYEIPDKLDKFDRETFKNSPMEFYVTCTDIVTGKPVYHRCDNADKNDIEWMRASASIPMAAEIVKIDGKLLLDGGMTDSIPVRFMQNLGYDKCVVILTQPFGYIKKKNNMIPLLKIKYKEYPNLIKALKNRHIMYNETLKYIDEQEKAGRLLAIRPPEALEIKHVSHKPEELERVYQIGRKVCAENLQRIKDFLITEHTGPKLMK